MDKVTNDARVYTNVQGLEELRIKAKSDPVAAKKEVAQQFEALLLQMVLRSMRDANAAFSSDAMGGNEMAMYTDMFDKQLTIAMSERGSGFAKMIEENIDHQMHIQPTNDQGLTPLTLASAQPMLLPHPVNQPVQQDKKIALGEAKVSPPSVAVAADHAPTISTPRAFVRKVWHAAKQAASVIGVSPAVLIAQAALETDWGKKVISKSNNLFNIKATNGAAPKVSASTLEYKNGLVVKEVANFKQYDSVADSFMDYAHLIKQQPRYEKALANAHLPDAYAKELQAAGFATDTNYASKIMAIMESSHFKSLIADMT